MKSIVSFFQDKELTPEGLKKNTHAIARCEFHRQTIYSKASLSLLAGFLLSLIICPQFGFGLPSGHGISHVFWLIGPWACAFFCGVFLFLCGSLSLGLMLNRFERFWFMEKTKGIFTLLPTLLWGLFMMMPKTHYVSVGYSLSWGMGFLFMWFFFKFASQKMVRASL